LSGPGREYLLRVKTFAPPAEVLTRGGSILSRRSAEAELTSGRAGWCYDEKAAMCIVRLPQVESEEVTLRITGGK
jgi:hypothetical protein